LLSNRPSVTSDSVILIEPVIPAPSSYRHRQHRGRLPDLPG